VSLALDGTKIEAEPVPDLLGPVHFSNLCEFALSAAHFKAAVLARKEPTRDMRIGTIGHHLVLGPHRTKPLVKYDGLERKGNDWKNFERETKKEYGPKVEIVTAKEWEDAVPWAEAVKEAMRGYPFLVAEGIRREVSMQWESGGILCETDGIDIVGNGIVADLKRTSCTEPDGFARHAARNLWHAQLAFYEEAAKQNGIDTSNGVYLVGGEPNPPYALTVMRLSEATLAQGRKSCVKWLELLRRARENDFYPPYVQTVVDFDLPPWMGGGEEETAG